VLDHYVGRNSVYVVSRNVPLWNGGTIYSNEDGSSLRRPSLRSILAPFFSPSGTNETSPVVGRSLSVQKQTAFVATAERYEGNRLETTSSGDGHKEIASLPSNDVTTNTNLITGPDIANRPGPVAVVV